VNGNPLGESDDRLMERAAAGSTEAFDAIVRRHQHRLQRFATRMLGGDAARGADVAVGALIRLWESRTTYQPCGKLEAWLIRTANRLCLDQIERDRPTVPLDLDKPSSTPGAQTLVERDALEESVREAVSALPESHRAVLVLSVYEGMSYREVADALDLSVGTVASRKNHAIALLRRRLVAWIDQTGEDR